MKKIDLHIHTIPTSAESAFVFSLESLLRYTQEAFLSAIAITNHDIFNSEQFRSIKGKLSIPVFPGIEINMESGHVLVIGDGTDIEQFQEKSDRISTIHTEKGHTTFEELQAVFGNLDSFLVIPHFDKWPSVRGAELEKLRPYLSAGEVDSAKKFVRCIKDESKITPVLFSDARMTESPFSVPVRQTYIDCGEVTLGAIKACLRDKNKVALSESDGNTLFQAINNGLKLSTGLNVFLGERSAGKTYTLDTINTQNLNVKYIKQFDLVQRDEKASEREFNADIQNQRDRYAEEYLQGFKTVIDDVIGVDLAANERAVDRYLETLLKAAEETGLQDSFSAAALYSEVEFPISTNPTLDALIMSVEQVIENMEFKDVIVRHLDLNSVKALIRELIQISRTKSLDSKRKVFVNGLIKDIKGALKVRSSMVQISDVDLYQHQIGIKKVERFSEIVGFLKRDQVIREESFQGYKVETKKLPFVGAMEVKAASGSNLAFSAAFKEYGKPYNYLRLLMGMEGLQQSILYRLFVRIEHNILNKDGVGVSGGERSEFRLLQLIHDAQNFDLLLIDEPESSFDNMFLNGEVNAIIKELSKSMPVVVVTHNSTVGASIGADYLLYASKESEGGRAVYRVYAGYPSDKSLVSLDGKSISSHDVLLNTLEAGVKAYLERRRGYEAVEN